MINTAQIKEGAFEFVRQMSQHQPLMAAGIFIPQLDLSNAWSFASGVAGGSVFPTVENEVAEEVQSNIKKFSERCELYGIPYVVHKDYYGFAMPELKAESRFADLLVIGSQSFYANLGEDRFNYITEVLSGSECPVVLVPEHFTYPRNNVLAYDGSAASVFAIKQFAYFFPELKSLPTLLVYSNEEGEDFPEKSNIRELASLHFKHLKLFRLQADPHKDFATWIGDRKDSLLVSGSHGRSFWSQVFRKSFINETLLENELTMFVAHQ